MATDIKKFLDQGGVSILWTRIAEELSNKQTAIDNVKTIADANKADITTMKGQIEALEAGTYDDSEIRELIGNNNTAIGQNTAAIATLNGAVETEGSVAYTATRIAATKIAEIVADADANFDTLKEIADWILNDTTGAANMANDIAALQVMLAGVEGTVVGEIAAEINAALKVNGVDKYALASDLTALADRVTAIEEAGYQNATQVDSAIDTKIAALNLATTYEAKGAAATALTQAKAYADGLATNYDASGAAAQALTDAKSYTDTEVAKIQALTEAEIDTAIAASIAQDANQTLY